MPKKNLIALLVGAMISLMAQAIPADPTPATITQPDGTRLTLVLHGDEFFHYATTTDGYTVVKDAQGYYTYASLSGDQLFPDGPVAHDVADRQADELAWLANAPRHLTAPSAQRAGTQLMRQRNSVMRRTGADGNMDYEKFRGLIILINYNDKQFSMSDANGFYDDMVNTHNYTGYTNSNGRTVRCNGSVRDYFYDNSMGIFDPHFDVVGPVTVDYACTYPQSTSHADVIFKAALKAVDDSIDFSEYDTDGDGEVDMVFFMVAGYSASYGGNNEAYLWPHMYYLWNAPQLDGVGFGLYACSTELYGWENYYSDVNGIGTICHEFSHVLGLPDLYDTDYTGSGGESLHPNGWDVMAGGSHYNIGRSPVGYSIYERYALRFATPQLIEAEGQYTLNPVNTANEGYRINTPVENEFFLLENRRQTGWDKFLPGEGMLVARVDSTNAMVWWQNTINANPAHMYYELLRAGGGSSDSGSDTYPGTSNVKQLSNYTSPSLQCWDGTFNQWGIQNIFETTDDKVMFTVYPDTTIKSVIEDFEAMPVTTDNSAKGVQGVYCPWDFTKCAVAEPAEGNCNGKHAVAMIKPSRIATASALNANVVMARYTVFNPTAEEAHFQLTYSTDSGSTWMTPDAGYLTVSAGESATCAVNFSGEPGIMLRINQTAGSAKSKCYLDDIELYYLGEWEQQGITGDVNGDGEVTIADVNAIVDLILNGEYDGKADVNADGEVTIADVNAVVDIILGNA